MPDESGSHRGLKSLNGKNLLQVRISEWGISIARHEREQKLESAEDYDTNDCSTDADSPVSLRSVSEI